MEGRTVRRRRFVASALTAGAVAGAGCVSFEPVSKTTTQRFDVADDERVTVTTDDADVTVRTSGDADRVAAHVTSRDQFGNEDALSKVSLESERTDGTLSLSVAVDDTTVGVQGTSGSLELVVPESTVVSGIDGRDADVAVSGSRGPLSVAVEDGDVSVDGVDGDVTVTTADGDLGVVGTAGDVAVTTEDGDATVTDADGFVSAGSRNGDVDVRGVGGVDWVRSEDGDVDVEVAAVRSDAVIRTADGDVRATLASSIDADLTAATEDGDVELRGIEANRDGDEWAERTFGDGTHDLTIRTDDGDVTLVSLS